jgi:hypothetical protein
VTQVSELINLKQIVNVKGLDLNSLMNKEGEKSKKYVFGDFQSVDVYTYQAIIAH